ncbi:MAG: hypothetical protein L0196_05000 [candidate division Zixibacteria bacterium]|nr:hypothetical protein [candidate division Zixibacteria bacterium]
MKTFWTLLLALGGIFLPGRLEAQENGGEGPGRPPLRRFGFGFGISSYSPDFSELNKAFTFVEDQYRNQGYTISGYGSDFGAAPLLWFTLRLRPATPIGVLLEAGTTADADRLDFKAVSASLLWYPFLLGKAFEPCLGAGIGRYHFLATRNYGEGSQISPTRSDGTYTYLDKIESEGGGMGLKLLGGLDLSDPTSKVSLGGFISYLIMLESVEGTIANGPKFKIGLNGLLLGGRMVINL